MCLERPTVFGALKKIQQKLKKEGIEFPLVEQNLYPTFRELVLLLIILIVCMLMFYYRLLHPSSLWQEKYALLQYSLKKAQYLL